MKFFGRLFFSKSPPYQQLKNMREMTVAIILGVLLSAIVGLVIYFKNKNAQ
jgi:LPXTG-motif cell wall-anchored protein